MFNRPGFSGASNQRIKRGEIDPKIINSLGNEVAIHGGSKSGFIKKVNKLTAGGKYLRPEGLHEAFQEQVGDRYTYKEAHQTAIKVGLRGHDRDFAKPEKVVLKPETQASSPAPRKEFTPKSKEMETETETETEEGEEGKENL